jgi:PAS domain S-box-containing protein
LPHDEHRARPGTGLVVGPGIDVPSEASFEVLFAALPVPAWLVDERHGDVLAANPAGDGRAPVGGSAVVRHVRWYGRAARLIVDAPAPPGAAEREVGRLLDAIEAGGLGMFRTDLAGRITAWDGASEALFGWTPAEILGRPATLLSPDDLARQVARLLRAVATGRELRDVETRGRTRNGRTFAIAISVAPTRDETGRIDGASAIVRDISRHKQLESRLRQAQKMEAIGRLAGGIAHDFNNLLTAIHEYAQLLAEALPEDDERRTHAEELLRAATRAGDLVRQLLAFLPPAGPPSFCRRDERGRRRRRDDAGSIAWRPHHAGPGARSERRLGPGRRGAARAGHAQPGDQRAGCDAARWRPAD